jgi:uncharacterized protein (TIGR03437 family)
VTTAVTGTNAVLLLTATDATMCCNTNATDTVEIGGTINAGDIATVTIAGNTYSYTVLSTDTLATIQTAIIGLINNAPDPNVNAVAGGTNTSSTNPNIVLIAQAGGTVGEGIPVTVSVSGSALTLATEYPATCCSVQGGTLVTVNNPAQPGEFVYVLATGLGPTNPPDQNTGEIFPGGSANPPAVPVDSILTGSFAATIVSAQLVPGTVGVYNVLLQLSSSATTDAESQTTIAQQTFVSNVITFPIQEPGYPFSADVLAAAGNVRKKVVQALPPPRRQASAAKASTKH